MNKLNQELMEKVNTSIPRPGTVVRKTGLLEKIASYVEENLVGRITLKGVADHCGVSVSTVTQLFQKCLGTTFHQYLTNCRMDAARTLIRDGVPLEEVGRQVGYSDHSTFYRAFRRFFGMSPRDYKKQQAGEL